SSFQPRVLVVKSARFVGQHNPAQPVGPTSAQFAHLVAQKRPQRDPLRNVRHPVVLTTTQSAASSGLDATTSRAVTPPCATILQIVAQNPGAPRGRCAIKPVLIALQTISRPQPDCYSLLTTPYPHRCAFVVNCRVLSDFKSGTIFFSRGHLQ